MPYRHVSQEPVAHQQSATIITSSPPRTASSSAAPCGKKQSDTYLSVRVWVACISRIMMVWLCSAAGLWSARRWPARRIARESSVARDAREGGERGGRGPCVKSALKALDAEVHAQRALLAKLKTETDDTALNRDESR
eukprot:6207232-Pleurochrysis_carterae.AAC.8